jgi:hypothetical protein
MGVSSKMKKMTFLSALLILTNICFSWQVKLIRTISIDERDLLIPSVFAVLEDGNLLFTDLRDQNHQIKVFNEEGKLIKGWGKFGPGPDEFEGAGFLDYQSPHLAVADAGKHRVHVFEKLENDEFKKIGELLAWESDNDIKIYDKYVLLSGYIVSPKGEEYVLFMRDFNGKETKYVLPNKNRFGATSTSEHRKIKDEVSGISGRNFLDVYQDTAFYVSDVRLRVAVIDLRSMKIEFIGKEPPDFRALAMNKKTSDALMDPRSGISVEDILTKHSFVNGVFADKDIVGVLYLNRDKTINNELFYVPRIQIYDHSGKLLHQQTLAPFFTEERCAPFFYEKDKRHLYLLSTVSDASGIKYVIYEFSVEP